MVEGQLRRMILRRTLFLAIAASAAGLIALLLARVLGAGGWNGFAIAIMACAIGVLPWLGICAANGLIGFAVVLLARDPARAVLPVRGDIAAGPITLRTAIAVTIRNEDMDAILPPLRALLDGLDATGWGRQFAAFVLSDTQDPERVAAETAAMAASGNDKRIRYRRRTHNAGFKAGNVMDFLDHHAGGFDLALTLDADSRMTPAAVLQLVRIMQAGPTLGIVQHLTVGMPARAAFPRLFQFNMRAGMRIWALGQAWWQGDEGPYWGHNAVLRIAPFRDHARLAKLPDGRDILSHDQVEAARLRAAGWGVCVWADEDGSAEQNPPALPEFFRRDERWMAGNLQYRHLLTDPGFRPMGRWQLVQAILLFATAPLLPVMLALASVDVALGGGAATPNGALLALGAAWLGVLYAPKLLGYLELLALPARRARYGGARNLLLGVLAETAFTLLLDAVAPVHKTLVLIRLALGSGPGWLPQNRGDRGVGWGEAARLLWPHTLFGVSVFALLAAGSWSAVLWALPFAGGLLVAIPFCVLTADPRLSAWLRRRGIAAVPEELGYAGSSYRGMNQSAGSAAAAAYQDATSG
jgi:membrane glycosyltransferase